MKTRKDRKKLSVRFLERLRTSYPHLYAQAIMMNQRDDFIMWDKRPNYKAKFAKKSSKKNGKGDNEETKKMKKDGEADVDVEEKK